MVTDTAPLALTPAEAADAIGLRPRTLAEWRRVGDGHSFVRIGGRVVRYLASDLNAWLADNRRRSTSDGGGGD